jgi:hypothetical protein
LDALILLLLLLLLVVGLGLVLGSQRRPSVPRRLLALLLLLLIALLRRNLWRVQLCFPPRLKQVLLLLAALL